MMMVVTSDNIEQFLVDERDANMFPILGSYPLSPSGGRYAYRPTIVWHVDDLVSLSIEVLITKDVLEHRKPTR